MDRYVLTLRSYNRNIKYYYNAKSGDDAICRADNYFEVAKGIILGTHLVFVSLTLTGNKKDCIL